MKQLIIIDDQIEMLESMEKLLSRLQDCSCTYVQDAQEALRLVTSRKFDLILTDLKMGKVSGIDILRAARSKFPDARVIIISGYGTEETIRECEQLGAFAFIHKLFTSRELFATINKALNKSDHSLEKHDL